jgi:hypothetical protein
MASRLGTVGFLMNVVSYTKLGFDEFDGFRFVGLFFGLFRRPFEWSLHYALRYRAVSDCFLSNFKGMLEIFEVWLLTALFTHIN